MAKRLIALVSNDLSHDQRVRKICGTLHEMGFDVHLLGRLLPESIEFERPYGYTRLRLFFRGGAMFYAMLNIRFFFYLLFHRFDVVVANDLDTLLPAYLVSKLKGKKLVYDSHEYFTEAAGLTGRNFQKNVWLAIEKRIFPKLDKVFTVNQSIAEIYEGLYQVPVRVLRNIPPKRAAVQAKSRAELNLPSDRKIILLQGAYLDVDRGAYELTLAMEHTQDVLLLIIGAGQEMELVKKTVEEKNLGDKVWVMGKMPFEDLQQYTLNADLGLSLDKPLHLNYKLSLPNKLFDYIQCQLPVVTSALPELMRVQKEFPIGLTIDNHDPVHIAAKITEALNSPEYPTWKQHAAEAAQVYNWEKESEIIKEVYADLL